MNEAILKNDVLLIFHAVDAKRNNTYLCMLTDTYASEIKWSLIEWSRWVCPSSKV